MTARVTVTRWTEGRIHYAQWKCTCGAVGRQTATNADGKDRVDHAGHPHVLRSHPGAVNHVAPQPMSRAQVADLVARTRVAMRLVASHGTRMSRAERIAR